MFRFRQPLTPRAYDRRVDSSETIGVNPLIVTPQGDDAQMTSSAGPQRLAKSTKETGKRTEKRKRIPKEFLPLGTEWPATYSRFCAEMDKICIKKPTGEVPDPETACAKITNFIKDDLHLSVSNFFYCGHNHHSINLLISRQPLAARQLGERPCRDIEQYLTGILNQLRPRQSGQPVGYHCMLERGRPITHLRTRRMSTERRSV